MIMLVLKPYQTAYRIGVSEIAVKINYRIAKFRIEPIEPPLGTLLPAIICEDQIDRPEVDNQEKTVS